MNIFAVMLCFLVAGCGNHKENGSVEVTDTKGPEVSVSEMLLIDKAPEESSIHKEFLKHFKVDRIHFGFDHFEVSKEAAEYLTKVAEYLTINLDLRVEIEGNCDIRGSKTYNIALGEKRANAIAHFLKKHGIAEHRISTVSFGSRVLVEGDSEEIYAQNRVGIVVVK